MKEISLILATDKKYGLGKDGKLVWNLPEDMAYFKKMTTNTNHNLLKINAVVMGKKTWESIPKKFRPLRGRYNIVLTRDTNYKTKGAIVRHDIEKTLLELKRDDAIHNIFIIGGSEIYNQTVNLPIINNIYLTKVLRYYDCDVFFNGIPKDFYVTRNSGILFSKKNNLKYKFLKYVKRKKES